ncbi:hypothetical protein BZARG_2291 [Bizionia argentinensis JUB59]|uniref:Uncharacterized protein n=1 Tax=Bizionia argentinensis JUB59 TaxID=1046627 RepID=G2EGN2_9FLAO|nr:hypothetical protein [Bizionia argentinensis]EGV42424.1 hypothetical protein BZARG_2291 [Bizionia argentinensis JUB59]
MSKKNIIFLLKISCFFIFIGRAYQHLFWDAPFRSLLWDQKLLSPIVEGVFNISWRDYVTDLDGDNLIQNVIKLNGLFYFICALISLFIEESSKKVYKIMLFIGGLLLLLLSLLLTKSEFYHISMFFEHTIQFGSPFILLYLFKVKHDLNKLIIPLKVIIAVAFISHGVYAIGTIYPLPANFVTMSLNILPVTENLAKELLFTAGILDFIVAILIFVPKTSRIALVYAAFWGVITALARVISGLTYEVSFLTLHQYLFETIYRTAHGIIPFACFMILIYLNKEKALLQAKSFLNLKNSNNINTNYS